MTRASSPPHASPKLLGSPTTLKRKWSKHTAKREVLKELMSSATLFDLPTGTQNYITPTAATLTSPADCCTCDHPDFELLHTSVLPFDIPTLWKNWFTVPAKLNVFLEFLIVSQKVTCIEVAPWGTIDDPAAMITLPLGQCGGAGYELAYEDVKVGMHRNSSRVIPIQHGIPFRKFFR